MAIKFTNDYAGDELDNGSAAPKRRTSTTARRSKSPKARRSRSRSKPPAVPGIQQRRNKHWSW